MFKLLIALTGFASVLTIVFGVPTNLGDFDLQVEDQQVAVSDLEDVNQYNVNIGTKEFTVVAFQKVNWFAAQQLCSRHGTTLISLNSEAEENRVKEFLIKNGFNDERFWTSGNNLAGHSKWFWASNGRALTYTNWASDQPDNASGQEQCLEFVSSNGKWENRNCSELHYFICENRCPLNSFDVPLYPRFKQ